MGADVLIGAMITNADIDCQAVAVSLSFMTLNLIANSIMVVSSEQSDWGTANKANGLEFDLILLKLKVTSSNTKTCYIYITH